VRNWQPHQLMVAKEEIEQAQRRWGEALVRIGALKDNRNACEAAAEAALDALYGYAEGPVLFKPTRCRERPFRLDREGAKSYFVGGDPAYPEDRGFALEPWTDIRFENAGVLEGAAQALAMGRYYFRHARGGEIEADYSFGYFRARDGEVKINLHHSSLPFEPSGG